MNNKKRNKGLAHAEMVFQREQLKAAMMQEQLDKSLAIIEENRSAISDSDYAGILVELEARRQDVKEFLMDSTKKYAQKLKDLGDPKIDFETDEVV